MEGYKMFNPPPPPRPLTLPSSYPPVCHYVYIGFIWFQHWCAVYSSVFWLYSSVFWLDSSCVSELIIPCGNDITTHNSQSATSIIINQNISNRINGGHRPPTSQGFHSTSCDSIETPSDVQLSPVHDL